MTKKTKKNSITRFIGSPLFLIVSLPLVFLLIFTFVRSYYSNYKIDQEIEALQKEIESLESKKLESMDILNYVMSSDFVEEKARTELNMKREGENVVVFKNETRHEEGQRYIVGDSGQNISNPLKWWYYFTKKTPPSGN